MGTSLYEQFQREQAQREESSLYDEYLKEQRAARTPLKASPYNKTRFRNVQPDVASARLRTRPGASGDFEAVAGDPRATAGAAADYAKFLGKGAVVHLANTAQVIPGARAVESGLLSAGSQLTDNPRSFGEARDALDREIEKTIPPEVRVAEHVAGGLALGRVLPLGNTKTVLGAVGKGAAVGGGLGAPDQLLSADPMTVGERAKRTIIGGGVGAGAGAVLTGAGAAIDKGLQLASIAKRVRQAPTVGASAVARDKAITAATKENYAELADEAQQAALRPTTTAVHDAFEDPDIAPFVEKVRASRRFQNADDATVAREADKLMTRQRRGWQKQQKELGYDADRDMKIGDLSDAQQVLRRAVVEGDVEVTTLPALETAQSPAPSLREAIDQFDRAKGIAAARREGTVAQQSAREVLERHGAENVVSPPLRGAPSERSIEEEIPPMLPSHPRVVGEKARMEAEREAAIEGAEMGSRIARGAIVNPKKAAMKSEEAYLERIPRMTPGEARAALEMLLGGAKPHVAFSPQFLERWAGGGAGLGLMGGGLPGGAVGFVGGLGTGLAGAGFRTASRLNRLAPYVDALHRAAGNPVRVPMDLDSYLRRMLGLRAADQAIRR
jgi:hypothetical protein